jgi:hypothetical protein
MNTCDHNHQTDTEIRKLPLNEKDHSNLLLCYRHFLGEMMFRRERNKELSDDAKFLLPRWESLDVYEKAIMEKE